MDIIFDNIFVIALLIVGGITQWLKARGEARQNREADQNPTDFEEMIEEAERRYASPPPVPSRSVPNEVGAPAPTMRRKSRELEPTLTASETSAELARQQQLADHLKEVQRTRGARELSDSLLPQNRSARTANPASGASLKTRLGNRLELRQALVLKEILEKPLGLR